MPVPKKGSKQAQLKMEFVRAAKKTQNGSSKIAIDKKRQALPVGKRISPAGNTYYEYRANESDKGKLLGVNKIKSKHHHITNSLTFNLDWLGMFNESLQWWKNHTPINKHDIEEKKINIKFYTDMIKETKTHIKELKKLI